MSVCMYVLKRDISFPSDSKLTQPLPRYQFKFRIRTDYFGLVTVTSTQAAAPELQYLMASSSSSPGNMIFCYTNFVFKPFAKVDLIHHQS